MKRRALETDVENKVVRWADKHGVLHTKLNIQFRNGWPDRVFWLAKGRPLIVEFKRVGEEPEPLQRYIAQQLKVRGYDVRWTDSAEEAIAWLARKIGKTARP